MFAMFAMFDRLTRRGRPSAADRDAVERWVRSGNASIAAGRYDEAEQAYGQAVALDPSNAKALLNRGFACKELGRFDEAVGYLEAAAQRDPSLADAHFLLGHIAEARGDAGAAMAHLGRAVACKQDFALAWQELCRLQFQAGRVNEAKVSAYRGLAADRDAPLLNLYLGNVLHAEGADRDAAEHFRRALAVDGDFAEAHMNLGVVLAALQQPDHALVSLDRALELDPDLHEAWYHRGVVLGRLRRFDLAEQAYRRALEADPAHADALHDLGVALTRQGRFDEAEAACARARDVDGDEARYRANLGDIRQAGRRYAEAEAAYRAAIALRPEPFMLLNLAVLLSRAGRLVEAEATYREALALRPDYAEAKWNLSLLLLQLGRMEEAWPLHESRYHVSLTEPVTLRPDLPFPQWQGEALTGRSIVLICEQGFGDAIQFVRYAAALKARGASRVSVVCKPPLKELFGGVDGVDAAYAEGEPFLVHDFWVLALSLPGRFDTRLGAIPASIPYLRADPERMRAWAPRLPAAGRRVGLVWKGAAGHRNDANRSLPALDMLAPLWSVPDTAFVSLQKGQGEEEAAVLDAARPMVHLGSEIQTFADTAAIVAQLDLVICVDTSIAHLAGALGTPCWVLLPGFDTDWRWLDGRDDSPWYPGVLRLFRQTGEAGWGEAVARVARELGSAPGRRVA